MHHEDPELDSFDSTTLALDTDSITYAARHNLHGLLDTLIYQVADKRPNRPAKFMAELVQARIMSRARSDAIHLEDLLEATATYNKVELGEANGENSDDVDREQYRMQSLARSGIWLQIRYSDLEEIVRKFRELLNIQFTAEEQPPDFINNTEFLIQMLATASVTEHYKGFGEAIKLVPLRPHRLAPQCCDMLCHTILDHVTLVIPSQRRLFLGFMERVGNHFRQKSKVDGVLIKGMWMKLKSQPDLWRTFSEYLQREVRLFNPIMGLTTNMMDVLERISVLPPEATQEQILTLVVQPVNEELVRRTGKTVLPDRFSLYAALLLQGLAHSFGPEVYSPACAAAFENILESVRDAINHFATQSNLSTRRFVRRGDSSLIRFLQRYFSNDTYRCRQDRTGHVYLSSMLLHHPSYTDGATDDFIRVAQLVLQRKNRSFDNEGHTVRCTDEAFKSMLHLLVALVHFRDIISLGESYLCIVRCHGFGIAPNLLYIHFQEAFSDEDTLSMDCRENAKRMLLVLQELCYDAYQSPILEEISKSLELFVDALGNMRRDFIADFMNPTLIVEDLTPELISQFLGVDEFLRELAASFAAGLRPEGVDKYFYLCSLMASRLILCRVEVSAYCDFLSMALLASCDHVVRRTPLHPLLPAVEVLVGLSPSLDAATGVETALHDRGVLLAHFQNRKTFRLLMSAVEDFLQTFPQYRSRVFRTSISFEAAETAFLKLLFQLLQSTENDLSPLLRAPAVQLAVLGILPRDYDLFGLSLARSLRSPDFPEAEWAPFYQHVVSTLLKLAPKVQPLTNYNDADIRRIILVQACARRLAVCRNLNAKRETKLHQLERLLQHGSLEDDTDLFDEVESSTITLSTYDARVVFLSWSALGPEVVGLVVFSALKHMQHADEKKLPAESLTSRRVSRRASSVLHDLILITDSNSPHGSDGGTRVKSERQVREEDRALLDTCEVAGQHLTAVIDVLGDESLTAAEMDDGMQKILRDTYHNKFDDFFMKLVEEFQAVRYSTFFVEVVRAKLGLDHPAIRVAWVSFMGYINNSLGVQNGIVGG